MADLKKLLQKCEFGDNLNDALWDGSWCNFRSEPIEKKDYFLRIN